MWAILICCAIPTDYIVEDTADVCEVNHYFNGKGEIIFDQIIFWDWDDWNFRYTVVAWRILKNVRGPSEQCQDWCRPGKWKGGHAAPVRRENVYVSDWYDEKDKVYRRVTVAFYRETHTVYDPEIEDRKIVPQKERRGLKKVPRP